MQILPGAGVGGIGARLAGLCQTGDDAEGHFGAGAVKDRLVHCKADSFAQHLDNPAGEVDVVVIQERVAHRDEARDLVAVQGDLVEDEGQLIDHAAHLGPDGLRHDAGHSLAGFAGHVADPDAVQQLAVPVDVLGDQVVRILDPSVFMTVLSTGRDVRDQRVYLAEYKRYVEQTVVYDRDSHLLIGIMRDVTDEEAEREKKENISRQTVEVADRVVEKQMRIVQEIASLLGETAAETKIALAKLKESITDE